MRQEILDEILFYNVELTKILNYKERYEIAKINSIRCKELVDINERIRLIEWMDSRNYNF
jgi:hypothetical protein